MTKVVAGMTISLDGFINDRNGSVAALYPNLEELAQSPLLQEAMDATGAVVMGRRSYDMAEGDFTGYEYQVPLFIVTHEAPETVAKGENDRLSFTFVTDGVESAIEQAKAAAGDKEVTIIGGAELIQQALGAGFIDELQIGVMPVLFGKGVRLFSEERTPELTLEKTRVIESPGGRTDIFYRVIR